MSTANDPKLDAADFAAILSTTLALAAEAGLTVGVRARPPADGRPAGLLIFIECLTVDPAGRLMPIEQPFSSWPAAVSAATSQPEPTP